MFIGSSCSVQLFLGMNCCLGLSSSRISCAGLTITIAAQGITAQEWTEHQCFCVVSDCIVYPSLRIFFYCYYCLSLLYCPGKLFLSQPLSFTFCFLIFLPVPLQGGGKVSEQLGDPSCWLGLKHDRMKSFQGKTEGQYFQLTYQIFLYSGQQFYSTYNVLFIYLRKEQRHSVQKFWKAW